MNLSPILRMESTLPKLVELEKAYESWSNHYDKCGTCHKQGNWYDPWTDWLCGVGRKLFTNWIETAGKTAVVEDY